MGEAVHYGMDSVGNLNRTRFRSRSKSSGYSHVEEWENCRPYNQRGDFIKYVLISNRRYHTIQPDQPDTGRVDRCEPDPFRATESDLLVECLVDGGIVG